MTTLNSIFVSIALDCSHDHNQTRRLEARAVRGGEGKRTLPAWVRNSRVLSLRTGEVGCWGANEGKGGMEGDLRYEECVRVHWV